MNGKIKTCFIGPFTPPFNGDGVKNELLKEGFISYETSIHYFNTIRNDVSFLLFFSRLIKCLLRFDQIMLSLNRIGRIVILPIVGVLKKIRRKKKAILFVVGGSFHTQLIEGNKYTRKVIVWSLKSLDYVFVESNQMLEGLASLGLTNVSILYNPRKNDNKNWELSETNRNKIVFISRVTRTKGIFLLIDAIEALMKNDELNIILDVYGPVDEECKEEFYEIIKSKSNFVNYRGVVDHKQVQKTLSGYHLFALPTYHPGEGLPGILVESGLVGLPVVVSKINALEEYFKDGEHLMYCRIKDVEHIKSCIKVILVDDAKSHQVSNSIKEKAKDFEIENIMKEVFDKLLIKKWELNGCR